MSDLFAPGQTRITPEFLKNQIKTDGVKYNRLGGTLTHCTITVKNGFTFTGESACVDPANYNKEIGEQIAFDNAFDEMWGPYGFALSQHLHELNSK